MANGEQLKAKFLHQVSLLRFSTVEETFEQCSSNKMLSERDFHDAVEELGLIVSFSEGSAVYGTLAKEGEKEVPVVHLLDEIKAYNEQGESKGGKRRPKGSREKKSYGVELLPKDLREDIAHAVRNFVDQKPSRSSDRLGRSSLGKVMSEHVEGKAMAMSRRNVRKVFEHIDLQLAEADRYCLLFVVCCLLFVVCCLLFIIHYSSFIIHHSSFII